MLVHLLLVMFWARHSRYTMLFVSIPMGLIFILCAVSSFERMRYASDAELLGIATDIVAHGIFLRFLLAALGVMNGPCEYAPCYVETFC